MPSKVDSDRLSISEPKELVERVLRFLRSRKEMTKASMLIVGMSGGLDSSVTAALCSLAVGGRNVLGACLPEDETRNQDNVKDASSVADKFSIKFETIDITELVKTTYRVLPRPRSKGDPVPYGNVKARLRAMLLYYLANENRGLVVGTGDKSELMLGYFTKFGDGACDIQPLADLYKTSVRDLARHLGLPKRVYSKPASPELWPGQTAEKELGLSYEKLDQILWGLERWVSPADIAAEIGVPMALVKKIRDRWLGSEHKRRPPLALKIGYRTAGADLRLPYSMG